ncbi:sensor domain-containing diguanylate cyclase [Pseudokineococcus lusitanus]|uniref:Diguanylate cyclase (GGDEF)-like protein n=1 Tax=Pseudokineococcus lusitanus TaxID=763993 RepID=A0A3N1GX17_9ACTN|nr:diguanylate cyclase [Pseudokineococcus lusitanus]ROP34795.1 diguanylate cyclase (GGDEF)-like protein [Pseudokineococcus lusitanus]
MDEASPRTAPRALARTAALAGAYAAATVLGRLDVMDGAGLALVWPAAGVAALWFVVQRRAGTVVVDAALLALVTLVVNAATGVPPLMALVLVVAYGAQVAVVQVLLVRWAPGLWRADGGHALTSAQQLAALVGAALVGSAVSGTVGVLGVAVGTGDLQALVEVVWVVRNAVSVVLWVAAGLVLAGRSGPPAPGAPAPARRTAEVAGLVVVTAAAYWTVFVGLPSLPVAYPLLVLTVWAALRLGTTVVAVHSLAVGAVAVVLTLAGHGPFAAVDQEAAGALLVQGFVGVVTVLGLTLALGREERAALLVEVRRQAGEAVERLEHVQVLARAARRLHTSDDVRTDICRAALEVSGADVVHLLEPDGAGHLVTTAGVGEGMPVVSLPLDGEPSITVEAYRSHRATFVADLATSAQLNPRMRGLPGVRSGLWQPVLAGDDRALGVLALVWGTPQPALPDHLPPMLETLASEAAAAVERRDLLRRLAEAADRDPLTGLANRRRWDEASALEVSRAQRTGAPLAVALVDLDHFKRFNDSRGHLAGDALLRDFAAAAREQLRDVDLIARWGGEEFALLLPGCTPDEAVAVLDRVRAVVPHGQTCTVGVTRWRRGEDLAAAVARADAALYAGKERGRDRTVVAPEPAPAVPAPRRAVPARAARSTLR